MGIRDKPTAPASPWQNGFAERLIGSIRRECLDHIIVLSEEHLRRILKNYAAITTALERIGHWTRMRLSLVRFSDPASYVRTPSWADFITTTFGFRLSVHTGSGVFFWGSGDRGPRVGQVCGLRKRFKKRPLPAKAGLLLAAGWY
jgi:hypothetical protein